MSIQVKAIFENGLLRPLQAVRLAEKQEVTVTIDEDDQVKFILPPDRWQKFCDALDAPSRDIPALRKLLTEASVLDEAVAVRFLNSLDETIGAGID